MKKAETAVKLDLELMSGHLGTDLDIGVGLHHAFDASERELGLLEFSFVRLGRTDGVGPKLVREVAWRGFGRWDKRRSRSLAVDTIVTVVRCLIGRGRGADRRVWYES